MNWVNTNRARFIISSLAVGIPLSSYYIYRNKIINTNIPVNSYTNTVTNRNQNKYDFEEELKPSFKTILFYKLINLEFSEITKNTVMVELLLISTPAVFAGFLSYYTYFNHFVKFKQKHFFNSINISLNTVAKERGSNSYKLRQRTIMDKDINIIIPNKKGVEVLQKAAMKATKEKPFIEIQDPDYRQSIRSLVRDHISALSYDAYVYDDLQCNINDTHNMWGGKPTFNQISHAIQRKYVVVFTTWPFGNKRFNRKIRVMLIKKSALMYLINTLGLTEFVWEEAYEDKYDDRWRLIHLIAKEFNDSRKTIKLFNHKYISTVELAAIDHHSVDSYLKRDIVSNELELDSAANSDISVTDADREFLNQIHTKLKRFLNNTDKVVLDLGVLKGRRKELTERIVQNSSILDIAEVETINNIQISDGNTKTVKTKSVVVNKKRKNVEQVLAKSIK